MAHRFMRHFYSVFASEHIFMKLLIRLIGSATRVFMKGGGCKEGKHKQNWGDTRKVLTHASRIVLQMKLEQRQHHGRTSATMFLGTALGIG